MRKALEIKNLGIQFKGFELKNVEFSVEPGTIMGLVGNNGAGKTTILKSILNFYKLKSGSIRVFGMDYQDQEVEVKNCIGYVAAEDYLKYNMTLGEYEKLFSQIYEEWDGEYFRELVARYQLPVKKKFSEFSKGMKTLAMLVLAMAHKPKLLVLDEPTAGLDSVVRGEFLEMLREFVEDGERAVLFSTHITTDLDKVADYITLLIQGEAVESASVDAWEEAYVLAVGEQEELRQIGIGATKQAGRIETLIRRSQMEQIKKEYPEVSFQNPNIEQIVVHNILEKR